jgi:hypothetical protein
MTREAFFTRYPEMQRQYRELVTGDYWNEIAARVSPRMCLATAALVQDVLPASQVAKQLAAVEAWPLL